MSAMKAFWEMRQEAEDEACDQLDPLDCEDPRCEDEMDYWDAEKECFDGE